MKPKSVDDYLASSPKEVQEKLKKLRSLIREAAPQAEEKISYSMPYYHYHGRLAYFAYAKNHLGLYVLPPVLEAHRADLSEFVTTKSAIHLSLDKPLPEALIKKLITTGMEYNKEQIKK